MTRTAAGPGPGTAFRRIGLVAKARQESIAAELHHLAGWLRQRGLRVVCDPAAAELMEGGSASASRQELPRQVDLVVVLGGDGTLLSVARAAGPAEVPVLGVNYGGLGFLTSTPRDELYEALEQVLAGHYTTSERMMLRARLEAGGEAGEVVREVLNDAVVNKTSLARIVELEVTVDGEFVSRYRADGVIVATPTGSTAYSLAAGGPIVLPSVEAILLTPICPHTLTNRPLVLPGRAQVAVRLGAGEGELVVTLDGQEGLRLRPGETVRVERSPHRVSLLQTGPRSYFEILRTKLQWGHH